MGISSVSTASVAKYGLTAIANCTSSEEARMQLMKWGAGKKLYVYMERVNYCLYMIWVYILLPIYDMGLCTIA